MHVNLKLHGKTVFVAFINYTSYFPDQWYPWGYPGFTRCLDGRKKRLTFPLWMRYSGADHCKMAFPQDVFLLWQQSNPLSTRIDNAAKGERKAFFSTRYPLKWLQAELAEKPWPAGYLNLNMPTCSTALWDNFTPVLSFLWLYEFTGRKTQEVVCHVKNFNLLKRLMLNVWNSCESKILVSVTFDSVKVISCLFFLLFTWSYWHLCADKAC